MNEELLLVVRGWHLDQLNAYIEQLEERHNNLVVLLTQLRAVRRTKERKKLKDNGERSGK